MIKDQATAFAKKAVEDFKSFSPGQKAVTLLAVVALAVGGYLLFTWKASPTYAPLYNNLAASDASSIADKLASNGISYKLANGGATIEVPASDVDKARLEIASAGLPNGGNSGYTLLDKEGVTTSQFQQQVDYQRAVEGELAKTIQSIQGVQAASVHLAIPQDTVFNDGTTSPTAAVLLTVAPGTQLTSSQVQSVVYLVSSSVTGMKATDVTVEDSNGTLLSAAGTGTTGITAAGDQAKQTTDYDNRIAASIQAMLDQALGPGHASVQVNAQLDFNKTSTTKNSYVYNPNTPAVSSSTSKETYSGSGVGPGGTLGATDTTGTSATGAGNNKYAKTQTVVNNALGTISQTTQNAPGALQNLHIAVMLDKSVKGLNVPALTQLVQSGVGFNQPRGDTMSVQAVPFDNTAQKQAAAAAKQAAAATAAAKSHDAMMSLIKQGVLVAIILAVVIGTWLASRKRAKRGAVVPVDRDEDDLIDDLTEIADAPTTHFEVAPQPSGAGFEAAQQRKLLVAAADNRPADLAHVLSGWLSPSEESKKS